MTLFFSLCCFTVCFMPSILLFKRVVICDPLRIILFVLGAFFWLLSLLLTSLLWTAMPGNNLVVVLFLSVPLQEVARGFYYCLLYKAQGGLAKLATDGMDLSGVRLMFSSRHVLAIVCGLGMGMMAALIMLTNILADYADNGVVGLPKAILDNNKTSNRSVFSPLGYADAYFPLYYSLSCALLILFNVVWTVTLWDGLHRLFHKLGGLWHILIIITLLCHTMNTAMSIWLHSMPFLIITLQFVLLILAAGNAMLNVKNISITIRQISAHLRNQPQPRTASH